MVCLALKMEDDGQNHLFHREWNKVINNAMKGVESFLVGHVICWALERDGLFPGGGHQAFQAGVCMKRDLFVAGSLGNPLLGLTQGLLSAADRFPTHASMAHRRCQGGPIRFQNSLAAGGWTQQQGRQAKTTAEGRASSQAQKHGNHTKNSYTSQVPSLSDL